MSQTQDNKETLDGPLNDHHITSYLTANPEFFVRHPDFVRDFKIPHQINGTISLIERQTELLRQKNKQVEQQLTQLIQISQYNESIGQRLQDLSLQMIGVKSLKGLHQVLHDSLLHHFGVDAISLRLTPPKKKLPASLNAYEINALQEMNISALVSDKPRCIALAPMQNDYLLGKQDKTIHSVALIPLSTHQQPGLLTLGSCDETRFHEDMDVHFLQYLASLINKVGEVVIPASHYA